MESINRFFDALPRTAFWQLAREAPAYRATGVAGFYVALMVTLAGGLMTGRSLPVLALLAAGCGGSFFGYAYLRRWVTGSERMVLLEHVWVALGCSAAILYALRAPFPGYLDIVSAGLCFFLAVGRAGCLMAGCCHGQPASIGIVYGEAAAREGFPGELVGVRLFPVPMVEMAGLFLIGISGLAALPFAPAGAVTCWFLGAYAILRFGLEGIRGDRRAHFLGLSQARWMALAQMAAVFWWSGRQAPVRVQMLTGGVAAGALLLMLAVRRGFDWRRRVLTQSHLAELQAAVTAELSWEPQVHVTGRGVRIAASSAGIAFGSQAHVSLSLAGSRRDIGLLCEIAARGFADLYVNSAYLSGRGVLHFTVPVPIRRSDPRGRDASGRARALYGAVLRRMQPESVAPAGPAAIPSMGPSGAGQQPVLRRAESMPGSMPGRMAVPWYFAPAETPPSESASSLFEKG